MQGKPDRFHVPPAGHFFGGLIERSKPLWIGLGNLESRVLAEDFEATAIAAPIYVTGLARSGTTILLEFLAAHSETASHRYLDYPPVYTPYWWDWFVRRSGLGGAPAVERTHGDGLMVTPESPEAIEEVLWMAFFDHLHDPSGSNVLDGATSNPAFERFYRDHISKLLLARKATRYLAKGNYNITRLGYLQKLFPDARFVVPIRDPVWHVASLMKQHALFREGAGANPRMLTHLRRVGHFEFGPDLRPINTGNAQAVREIQVLWAAGHDIEAWSRYWSGLYEFLANSLDAREALRDATLIVRFEDLCDDPGATIETLLAHCRLDPKAAPVRAFAARLRKPDYYRPDFTAEQRRIIERHTGATARRFGYGTP